MRGSYAIRPAIQRLSQTLIDSHPRADILVPSRTKLFCNIELYSIQNEPYQLIVMLHRRDSIASKRLIFDACALCGAITRYMKKTPQLRKKWVHESEVFSFYAFCSSTQFGGRAQMNQTLINAVDAKILTRMGRNKAIEAMDFGISDHGTFLFSNC
jgi:hypothetical protein